MSPKASETGPVSSGVEALIARLREEGVAQGRAEAERIIAQARGEAERLLQETEQTAAEMIATARAEVERLRISGQEALHIAARDTRLALKAELAEHFATEVRRLVSLQLGNEELMRRLILEIAGRLREEVGEDTPITILLPRDVMGLEELRRNPSELQEGTLTRFVQGLTGEMLRQGVSFGVAEGGLRGLQVRVEEAQVSVDVTDETVTQLLLQHLQPRFRALLEGIVK